MVHGSAERSTIVATLAGKWAVVNVFLSRGDHVVSPEHSKSRATRREAPYDIDSP